MSSTHSWDEPWDLQIPWWESLTDQTHCVPATPCLIVTHFLGSTQTTSGAQVVTMSSESEGDEHCSNGRNGSHFEPPSHHVTPIAPLTQVAPGMMMGQTNVSMQSMGMPQSTVQTAELSPVKKPKFLTAKNRILLS